MFGTLLRSCRCRQQITINYPSTISNSPNSLKPPSEYIRKPTYMQMRLWHSSTRTLRCNRQPQGKQREAVTALKARSSNTRAPHTRLHNIYCPFIHQMQGNGAETRNRKLVRDRWHVGQLGLTSCLHAALLRSNSQFFRSSPSNSICHTINGSGKGSINPSGEGDEEGIQPVVPTFTPFPTHVNKAWLIDMSQAENCPVFWQGPYGAPAVPRLTHDFLEPVSLCPRRIPQYLEQRS